MKVPHSVVGRIGPQTNPLEYRGDGLAKGLASIGGLGQEISQFGQQLKQREDQTARFGAMRGYSDFQTQTAQMLTELKRSAPPDGANFPAQASAAYDDAERKFLSTLPADLQEQFRAESGGFKRQIMGDALSFQYDSQDAYYKQGIDTEFQKSKKLIDPSMGGSLANLDAEKKRMGAFIAASGLPEQAKADYLRNTTVGLEGIAYKNKLQEHLIESGGKSVAIEGHVGQIIDAAAAKYGVPAQEARAMAWIESRGDPNAVSPTGATGLFQFTQGTAAQYGLSDRKDAAANADAAMRLYVDNRDGLRKALGREPTFGEIYLAHQQGLGGAAALLKDPARLAGDVVGEQSVRVNGGAPGMTAGQFANLWIKRANAAIGEANIDSDPAFSNLPYEDRLAARRDAEAGATDVINANAQQQKQENAALLNTLLLSIHNGEAGQREIDAAQQTWLKDYDDLHKADEALAARDRAGADLRDATTKIADPAYPWGIDSEKDKKAVNTLFQQQGKSAFAGMDQGYVNTTLLPMIQQTHLIPSDALGALGVMTRSNDRQRGLWAYNTLAMMQDADPNAFAAQTSEELSRAVDFWRARKDTMPADELWARIQGGNTQQERQASQMLRKEAEDTLTQKKDGVPKINEMVSAVVGSYGGIFKIDPVLPAQPTAARAFQQDFQTAFIDAYELYGNTDEATAAATKQMHKWWGVTEVGGKPTLMKYAPEKVGYPQIGGSYEWMTNQLRTELAVPDGSKAQLIADGQTRDEALKWQTGGPAPSYKVVTTDAEGTPHLVMDERPGHENEPRRIYFQPTAEDRQLESDSFDLRRAENELRRFERLNEGAMLIAVQQGKEVPQELLDQKAMLQERVQELRAKITKPAPKVEPPAEPLNAGELGSFAGSLVPPKPEPPPFGNPFETDPVNRIIRDGTRYGPQN